MEVILPYLRNYEAWIYGLLGIVALFYLQKLIVSWKDWQGSLFGLEREIAQRRFSTALTILLLLAALIFLEFFTVSFIAPSYPQSYSLPTPTLDLLATPTVTLAVVDLTPEVEQTMTVSASYAATPSSEGCTPGLIEWLSPTAGQEISGTVELRGTVNVPNLGFYKYRFSKVGEDAWEDIAAGDQPKVEGQIGVWNTSTRIPGDYLLSLVVLDNQNQAFPECIIPVRIVQP